LCLFSYDKLAACLELVAACPVCPATTSLRRASCHAGALLPMVAVGLGAGQFSLGEG